MKREKYLKFHKECCDKMIEITEKKNHDYAGFGESAFDNFMVVEKSGIASTEQGFLTRMMDKISRINSFIKQGVCNVKDESIEDTLLDLANYSILMAGYIKSKKPDDNLGLYKILEQPPCQHGEKPEFKKKVLEQKITELENNIKQLTLILSEQKKDLEEKKKELSILNKADK